MSLVQSSISDLHLPRILLHILSLRLETSAYRNHYRLSLSSKHSLLYIYRDTGHWVSRLIFRDWPMVLHRNVNFPSGTAPLALRCNPVPPRGIVAFYIQHLASGIFPSGTSFRAQTLSILITVFQPSQWVSSISYKPVRSATPEKATQQNATSLPAE